jgi:CheY-like chemotaxis protein
MARVLLVENEGVWLNLIRQALPEFEVDQAQSFESARALLDDNVPYDVAIVDLNLLKRGRDRLGGRLLEIMKRDRPEIRRIGMTGVPPTAVRELFERYGLDDLLLKTDIDLAVVRDVVETALKRVGSDVADDFRVEKLELKNSLDPWRYITLLRMRQRAQTLENDIRDAERVGKKADDSVKELAALETRINNLEAECAELTVMVSNMSSDADAIRVKEEFERLRSSYQV